MDLGEGGNVSLSSLITKDGLGGISSEGSDDPCFDTNFVCDELFVDLSNGSESTLFFAISEDVDTTSVFPFNLLD